MKQIVLTEKQERALISHLLTEDAHWEDKENAVENWLSTKYKAIDIESKDNMGLPKKDRAAAVLDSNGLVSKTIISRTKVFYALQAQFKQILSDEKERNEFLWEVLNNWINK